ncbi:hypothetical protein M5K25_001143 [Dendrobium thyrsiflorum]|uniref:Uncharacterized protein n=1 Tax=Dendrobium thyrsiflorum TaxID=117978 RepID=A0ABD0VV91_DENTH
MSNLAITGILEKMTGKDKDYRYMATSDLLNELSKDGFKADIELEVKLSHVVLQQLEDVSGDVSGLAVKWDFLGEFTPNWGVIVNRYGGLTRYNGGDLI